MKASKELERYYTLFRLMVEKPRITPSEIAREIKYTGRGRSPSTIFHHIERMYESKISFPPQMALRAFRSYQKHVFFCRRTESGGLYSFCKRLEDTPEITYALCFSSLDFFIISKEEDIALNTYGLEPIMHSRLYTPLYPFPRKWSGSFESSIDQLLKFEFTKGRIERKVFDNPDWDDLDWRIFYSMKDNIREKFSTVAKNVKADAKTVKSHFYKNIIPGCVQINYFFPLGFDSHRPVFLNLRSDCEQSFISALEIFPATSYVFPLENSLALIVFAENMSSQNSITALVSAFEKLEKEGNIEDFLLFCPLIRTK